MGDPWNGPHNVGTWGALGRPSSAWGVLLYGPPYTASSLGILSLGWILEAQSFQQALIRSGPQLIQGFRLWSNRYIP